MREQNFCFPEQQRACLTITPSLYDRRALDCTAPLPLLTSLMHLSLMTSSSQRVREALSIDGGLERLTNILETTSRSDHPDRRSAWRWILAYHCLVNVGVRGSEQIRARVERSGGVRVIIRVLESYLKTLESMRMAREPAARNAHSFSAVNLPMVAATTTTITTEGVVPMEVEESLHIDASANAAASTAAARVAAGMTTNTDDMDAASNMLTDSSVIDTSMRRLPTWAANLIAARLQQVTPLAESSAAANELTTMPLSLNDPEATNQLYSVVNNIINQVDSVSASFSNIAATQLDRSRTPNSIMANVLDEPPFREEDILLALQLLAYLSKHPSIRDRLHANYSVNVFTLVERFCARHHSHTIQLWAGVVMRNGCRKDDTRGGLRRCAYLHCGRWESRPHEFAKCRRCRKAKYCSKQCQSHAWADGHRYWCVARQPTASTNAQANGTTAINDAINAATTTTTTTTTTTMAGTEIIFPTITTTTTTTTTAATNPTAHHVTGLIGNPLNDPTPHPLVDIGLTTMPPTITTTPMPTGTAFAAVTDDAATANAILNRTVGAAATATNTITPTVAGINPAEIRRQVQPSQSIMPLSTAPSSSSSSSSSRYTTVATTSSSSSMSTATMPLVNSLPTINGHITNPSRPSSATTTTTTTGTTGTDDDDEDDLMVTTQSNGVNVTASVTLTAGHRTPAAMAAVSGTSSSTHATRNELSTEDELSTTEHGTFHTSAFSLS